MATGRKENGPRVELRDEDEFDKLGDRETASNEDTDEYFAGYRRRRIIMVMDADPTEEEHRERQRVLMHPVTLEEKIAAYICGNIFEIDGKIDLTFQPLIDGLEKCGITADELWQLRPDLAVQNTDNKGRPI